MHAYISAWSLFRYITWLFSYSGHILLWFLKMFLLMEKKIWLSLFFLHFFSKPEAYCFCLCFGVLVKKQYAGITFEFWAWFKFNISNYPIHNEKNSIYNMNEFSKTWSSMKFCLHPSPPCLLPPTVSAAEICHSYMKFREHNNFPKKSVLNSAQGKQFSYPKRNEYFWHLNLNLNGKVIIACHKPVKNWWVTVSTRQKCL